MLWNFTKILFVTWCFFVSVCISVNDNNYFSKQTVAEGLVFPSEIDTVAGEDIFLKITEPVNKQKKCAYQKPGTQKYVDVKTPQDNHVEAWRSEKCGLRIKNVSIEHQGIWRLASLNDNAVAKGSVWIKVREFVPPKLQIIDSLSDDLTPDQTSYCYVLRPDQTKTDFPMHSKCEFPPFNNEWEANGFWNIIPGIQGKTDEESFQVNVQIKKTEDLQTFVEHDKKAFTLNMKCSLLYSDSELTFCRFLRLVDDVGMNLIDGQGIEKYRYFGNGFVNRECGLSILNPNENDKSTWKCYMGINTMGTSRTIGAILDGSERTEPGDIEAEDVYGLHDSRVNILCKNKSAADYCWFRHPTGEKIPVSDKKTKTKDDKYSYYGVGLKLGECGITIEKATVDDSGTWSCHIGTAKISSLESSKEISVRVSKSYFVSSWLFQDASIAAPLLVECRSIPAHIPVDYCRFVLPDGTSFSINENTTATNPFLGNYYFNPNRHMKSGYCAIVVEKITKKHMGQWTCAGRLAGHVVENGDDFRVNVFENINDSNNDLSAATISGMVIGAVLVFLGSIAIGYISYRKRFGSHGSQNLNMDVLGVLADTSSNSSGTLTSEP